MFQTAYYPQSVKKLITAFGTLFSKIQIVRQDATGAIIETVKVPIAYGPKEKFILRVDADPNLTNGVLITLPRLSFEITGYNYDSARKVNRNNKIQCMQNGVLTESFSPAPYNVGIRLSLLSKGTEDALAVLEQILPLFTPEYTVSINQIPGMHITSDIPIVLNGVSVQDDYEGDFSQRRMVIHTFDFTAKLNIFAPITNAAVIKNVTANLKNQKSIYNAQGTAPGVITIDRWTNQ